MDKQVVKLLRKTQYEQRTKEWFKVRESLITASSAASLLIRDKATCEGYVKTYKLEDIFDYNGKSCNPYSNKTQYMLDKCRDKKFTGNTATYWGQKYEPVVTDLYSVLTSKEVMEFGLLIHDEYEWLGASPDGITPCGVMIEIKCPFRRKITGVPPLYYYIQVQLQLEVCDLEYCDFVEYEFTEFSTEEEWVDDITLTTPVINKGIFIQINKREKTGIPYDPAQSQYVYPEKQFIDKPEDLLKWRDTQLEKLPELVDAKYKDCKFEYVPVYWKVTDKSIVRIERDRNFFKNIVGVLEQEHKQLLFYKKNGNYKNLISQEKTYFKGVTVNIDLTDDDECLFSDGNEILV